MSLRSAPSTRQPGDTIYKGDAPAVLHLALHGPVGARSVYGEEHWGNWRALGEAGCYPHGVAVLAIDAHDDPPVSIRLSVHPTRHSPNLLSRIFLNRHPLATLGKAAATSIKSAPVIHPRLQASWVWVGVGGRGAGPWSRAGWGSGWRSRVEGWGEYDHGKSSEGLTLVAASKVELFHISFDLLVQMERM